MQQEFQVFLSYSRNDSEAVTTIAETLKKNGITVWLDVWELRPGLPWMDGMEEGLKNSLATAIFIGPEGLGKWERPEMRVAIDRQVKMNLPVIPVMLPGCPPDIEAQLSDFLKSYTWVDFRQRSLNDEKTIKRLRFGITGQKPTDDAPAAPPKPQGRPPAADGDVELEIEDAVADLASFLPTGDVTFYLGPWTLHGSPNNIPSACEITRKLLLDLQLIEQDYDSLLPPVDIAGMYYSVRRGDARLENDVIGFITSRANAIPPTHVHIASLLNLLKERRPQSRVRRRRQQLIVTTNLDVSMERALLTAGVPFTRIVQHRSAQRITVNQYRDVRLAADGRTVVLPLPGGGTQDVAPDDFEKLDAFIAEFGQEHVDQLKPNGEPNPKNPLDELPVQEMIEPILYKHLGSLDVQQSCAITIDHFFTFARRMLSRNCVPAKITEIIGTSPALFLGYGFLDPDFRVTYYTLLRKPFEIGSDSRYAVQLSPAHHDGDVYRRMESGLWNYIKKAELKRSKITTVEAQSAFFLERLLGRVRQGLRP
jgi:hypothetical protein